MEMRLAAARTSVQTSDGLNIRLLGEIRLRRSDETIALPASKRTRALLGYLIATAAPQPRQSLCDLLWDGPDDPRAALRWSLTKLRPLLNETGRERLRADREHISFSAGDASIDVTRLGAMPLNDLKSAALAEIEEAAELLRGEFLDGLDLPSCYRFHHWCLAEREKWGKLRAQVLVEAVTRLADAPDRPLPYARAWVAADPLSEAAHGRLVALLAALGRRKDAQDHYDYARDMLRRELGAPIGGDLRAPTALSRPLPDRRSSEKTVSARAAAPSDIEPKNVKPTGLVGRADEQRDILASLDALIAGAAHTATLFLGEPGIGKSTLLDFAARNAAYRGVRVAAARCYEAEAVRPYGCWADMLGALADDPDDTGILRRLGLSAPGRDSAPRDDGNRTRLFAAITELLNAKTAKGPLALIIDDLQWIDEASASLLHYCLRSQTRGARFLLIGAARADEIGDNPWCKRLIGSLAQDGAVNRIALQPFDANEAAHFFGPRADSDEIARALRESGGNPLFLSELANSPRHGVSTVRDLDTLIGDRLARLDETERDLIQFASAMTRDFRPEVLGEAMGLPEPEFIDRIDRLERRGLLRPNVEGRFGFAHDLVRQVTYRSLSQPRRRLIHRRIARALEEAAQLDSAVAGELAYQAGAAGEHFLAVRASIASGEHCLRLFANAAAMDAADRGLGHLQHLPQGAERAHCHIGLLKVKVFASATPGVRIKADISDELRQAVQTAELIGLRDDDAALGWHMISWWSQRENDTAGASEAILRAEELTRPIDDAARCQQLASTGRCLLEVEFDVPRARAFVQESERLAEVLRLNFAELDWGRGLIARWDGDLERAQTSMRRALALARLREDRWREMECLVWMGKIAIEAGNFEEASAFCDAIDAVADRVDGGPAPVADSMRCIMRLQRNDIGSEDELEQTLKALRALDDKAQLAYVLNQIATILHARGDVERARATAAEALEAARTVKRATEIVVANSILAALGVQTGKTRQPGDLMDDGAGDVSRLSARARDYLHRQYLAPQIPTANPTGMQ